MLTTCRVAIAGRAAFGTYDAGRPRGILGDEELLKVIGDFPLSTLSAFPGVDLDGATVRSLVQQVQDRAG